MSNAQTLTVNPIGVSNGVNDGSVTVRMSVLLGGTTADSDLIC